MSAAKTIKVTLVKSPFGRLQMHRACVRGLGGNAFCKLVCGASSSTCVKTGGIEHCMP